MPRGLVVAEMKGLKGFVEDMGRLIEEFPAFSREALKAQQSLIEDQIRLNWVSMGGSMGGFVYSSVGQSATFSKQNPVDVVGTVGVYTMDAVNAAFGKTEKDLNAAQIAYWMEFGTSRLRSGQRKKRGKEYSDEELVTTTPRPFITTAYNTTIQAQEDAFREKFNQLVDRIMK